MTADEIRHLLLYAPRTEENSSKIPDDADSLWLSRPTNSDIETAKWGTYIRGTLLALTLAYTMLFGKFVGNETLYVFIIICYEFSYTALRRQKTEADNFLARERYQTAVDSYLKVRFPSYRQSNHHPED